jgi:very-short-patch-repair endonuclease
MSNKSANIDLRLAVLAWRQHGVVTGTQLRELGVARSTIAGQVRAGRLRRLHQGVYAVGHDRLSDYGRWLAAVLACGEGAVLSYASAAALWQFLPPIPGPVEVSIPSLAGRRQRAGIRIHRTSLPPRDLARRADIPVTTPRRTIRDMHRSSPGYLVRRAAREAQHTGFRVTTDRTRSDLEADFLAFCRRHRLPPPEVNLHLTDSRGRFTIDFLWQTERLIVETDSYEYHRGSISFEDDHARDLALRGLGFEVLRYTGRQLDEESALVATEIRGRLGTRSR